MDSKIKMTQDTQYEPIKIAIKTQINQKQNCNTKLYGILHKIAQQDAPIGISKQHTNSKRKFKNSKKIWK